MGSWNEQNYEGRVNIKLCIPDSHHVSGGPFCCFVKVTPIASDPSVSEEPVTLDFIALNVYGRACFKNRLLDISKLQSNLRFGFLTEERETSNSNDNVHLIFSSDSVIFSTFTEITPSSPASYYRLTCTIPPFIPPTVDGEHVSCNYYVEMTVQYNSCATSRRRETTRQKLEFHVVGSIYAGIPTLDDVFHPFLPKSGGYHLENGMLSDDDVHRACLEVMSSTTHPRNMLFNYDSRIECLNSEHTSVKPPDKFLFYRDLNVFWHVWDTMNGSGFQNIPEETYIIQRYEGFAQKFSDVVMNDPTGEEVEKFRPWFGSMLLAGFYNSGNKISESKRSALLQKFLKSISSKIESIHNTNFADLHRTASDSLKAQMEISLDDSVKVMNFSIEGQRLCTCNFQGFGQLRGTKEFTLPVNSWFTIFLDFADAFKCLQVDIRIIRTDTAGVQDVRTSDTCVLQRSLYTLGKVQSSVTLFLPMRTTPSFICSFLKVSYRLEICFHYFSEPVDFLKPDPVRNELNKLSVLSWENPIRLLQSESIRIRSRCFNRDEPVPAENTLQLARTVCDRASMPKLLHQAPALSTSINIY